MHCCKKKHKIPRSTSFTCRVHRFPDESKVGRLFYKNYALYSHETAKYYSNSCTLFA